MQSYTLLDILCDKIFYTKENEEIEKHISGVKVPRIQRDYAQGREEEKIIRNRFLKSIFKHLVAESELMELDFIYGSLKVLDDDVFFIPLDGQQRLTTLFLLYWYVSNKELDEGNRLKCMDKLAAFSYETRPIAKQFCKKLIAFKFKNDPVKELQKTLWFLDSFEDDPTVKSMMNMIAAINVLYSDYDQKIFDRLDTLRFYILPLDGFDLTDELYIKMNARGKQLSDFENFKADFVSWMKSSQNSHSLEFHRLVTYHSQIVPYYLAIASKLDNEWSDVFWSNRKEIDYDKAYFAFITRYLLTHHVSISTIAAQDVSESELFKAFTRQKDSLLDFKYTGFDHFDKILDYSLIVKLERVLDQLSVNCKKIDSSIAPLWNLDNKWKLHSLDIIPRQYVLFYSVARYLESNDFDEFKFKDWIRVVWNIIIDPTIRTFAASINTIRFLLKPLSDHSSNILEEIVSEEVRLKLNSAIKNEAYEQSILFQEIGKAKLINDNPLFKALIYDLESHPMFKGHVSFILNAENIEQALTLKETAFRLCVNLQGVPDKPANYHWLRAVLILNDDLMPYLNIGNTLSLSDGRFDQWNRLINNELRSGFYRFLTKAENKSHEVIKEIIGEYEFNAKSLWLWNLAKETIVVNDGDCSLLDFSESKNVKNYGDKTYLFNKNIWTDSNIMLSTYRNQLISSFLAQDGASMDWPWGNIADKYFRGSAPLIKYKVDNIVYSLFFYDNCINICVWQDDLVLFDPEYMRLIEEKYAKNGEHYLISMIEGISSFEEIEGKIREIISVCSSLPKNSIQESFL
ncbi:DUF262 domain-containing protein [Sphingobacterium multivorum]|uniref:DUF262 domain-containing protein n=1 Tax=Sphingobacterium multivorum TaxID=28454 RepID=UPI0028B15DE9|nr:DUF262 domain-containing protein [Sphingobacterium multivorum]